MQLPQKWQAGRVCVGTVSVALRTWISVAPTERAARRRISSLHFIGTGGRNSPSGRSSRPSRLPQTPTSRSMVS